MGRVAGRETNSVASLQSTSYHLSRKTNLRSRKKRALHQLGLFNKQPKLELKQRRKLNLAETLAEFKKVKTSPKKPRSQMKVELRASGTSIALFVRTAET
jgi:hypothetical protein